VAGVAFAAASIGALMAIHYHRLGLTLSHYDARGHLVVARRIIDSITPGWQQIGAVWLPLPHLLNAIPVQIDLFYRTGASAVAISILSFAVAASAIVWLVSAVTATRIAGVVAAAVFVLNPNVLYLQSTPMTESLLLALTLLAVAMLIDWADLQACRNGDRTRLIGWLFALACLTRYEAWPVTAAALTGAVWARWREGEAFEMATRRVGRIALYPALAVAAFAVFSRIVAGRWFVASDFFVPENKALGDPVMAVKEIAWGATMLSGSLLIAIGVAGLGVLIALGLLSRARAFAIVALSMLAVAAIPWAAFVKGHPFRIRYMVPLVAMEAIGAGVIVGVSPRRARVACALAVLATVAYELRPLDASAPMVVEAQWDRPNVPVRAQVTACLGPPRRGMKIMASMGSLGHYMQEMSYAGFVIRDFLHEGNGDLWLTAVDGPYPFAQWILIEEKAQGGDALARIARDRPHFLDGYRRVCEGAGLALYERTVGTWGPRDVGAKPGNLQTGGSSSPLVPKSPSPR
jgi:hypothetical protein